MGCHRAAPLSPCRASPRPLWWCAIWNRHDKCNLSSSDIVEELHCVETWLQRKALRVAVTCVHKESEDNEKRENVRIDRRTYCDRRGARYRASPQVLQSGNGLDGDDDQGRVRHGPELLAVSGWA